MSSPPGDCLTQSLCNARAFTQTPGKRPGIEQRHVGTLSELGARRMPGIADVNEGRFGGVAQRPMGIMSESELLGIDDLIEQRRTSRPECLNLRLPGVQSGSAPRVEPIGAQRSEERSLWTSGMRCPADRQDTYHRTRSPIALFERCIVETGSIGPIQTRPQRSIR